MPSRGAPSRLPRRAAPERHDAARAPARRAPRGQRLLGHGGARGRGPAPADRLSRGGGLRRPRPLRLRARVAPDGDVPARLGAERRAAVRGVVGALGSLPAGAAREVAAESAENSLLAGTFPGLGVRRHRPASDPRLDPDREVARDAPLRPDVRALAPLPRDLRGRPRASRPGARSHVRAARRRPGRRLARGSSSSSSSTRSRRASRSRVERTRSTSGSGRS